MRFTQEGWQAARDQVGKGKLVGKIRINQIYAKYQHERLDLRHPHGGGAKYLQRPLYDRASSYLQRIAAQALEGSGPDSAMIDCMEALAGATSSATPVEFNNLRRSANPKVYSNGALIYNRPPEQSRLSDAQLKAMRRHRRGRRR